MERDIVFPLRVEEQSSALTPTAAWGASLSRWISDTGASPSCEPTQFDGNGNIRSCEVHLWRHREPTAAPASGFRMASPGPPADPVVLCSVCGNPIMKDEHVTNCKACSKSVHRNCSSKCPGCSESFCTSCAVPHSMGACLVLAKMTGAELAAPPASKSIVPKPLQIIPMALGIPGSAAKAAVASSVPLPKFAAVSRLSPPPGTPDPNDPGDKKDKKVKKTRRRDRKERSSNKRHRDNPSQSRRPTQRSRTQRRSPRGG